MEEKELTVREATELLQDWAAVMSATYSERDALIRTAYRSGIGKSRIAQLTGLARSTVARIVREPKP